MLLVYVNVNIIIIDTSMRTNIDNHIVAVVLVNIEPMPRVQQVSMLYLSSATATRSTSPLLFTPGGTTTGEYARQSNCPIGPHLIFIY